MGELITLARKTWIPRTVSMKDASRLENRQRTKSSDIICQTTKTSTRNKDPTSVPSSNKDKKEVFEGEQHTFPLLARLQNVQVARPS